LRNSILEFRESITLIFAMGECGSGSRRGKMTHKNRNEEIEK
jgi:hypothetical protein